MFEDIAERLSAAELEEILQILLTRGEALLCALRTPGMLSQASELAEAAHKLAGGAGIFGFLLVAAAAGQFELAADSGAPEAAVFGNHLTAAIEASLTIVRQELRAVATIAT
jgi:HPt (histidine-containing phosphotransfer) domain-containing protein